MFSMICTGVFTVKLFFNFLDLNEKNYVKKLRKFYTLGISDL